MKIHFVVFWVMTVSRTALGLTRTPIEKLQEVLSLGVKRPGREADHSPPSSDKIKTAWSYTFTPPIRFHGMVTFYLHLWVMTPSSDVT